MNSLWLFLWGCATHSITGTVQAIDQSPIAGASCTFFDQQVQSDDTGGFKFTSLDVKKGEYSIQCTHKGYEFYEQSFLIEGSKASIPPIVLNPLEVQIPYLRINLDPEGTLIPNE